MLTEEYLTELREKCLFSVANLTEDIEREKHKRGYYRVLGTISETLEEYKVTIELIDYYLGKK